MTKEKLEKIEGEKEFRIVTIFSDSQEAFSFEKLKLIINNCWKMESKGAFQEHINTCPPKMTLTKRVSDTLILRWRHCWRLHPDLLPSPTI